MLLELADVLGPCDRRDAATADHSPLWFLDAMSRYVAETELAGGMDTQTAQLFHNQFTDLEEAMCGCERIKTTPVPFAVTSHLRTIIAIWIVLLPLALYASTGWWALFITFLVSYVVIGIEHVATECEMPFEHNGNSLALGRLCDTVRANVLEILERSRNETKVLALTAPRPVWHGLCKDELA